VRKSSRGRRVEAVGLCEAQERGGRLRTVCDTSPTKEVNRPSTERSTGWSMQQSIKRSIQQLN
jgi:hypothetical protein